MADPATPATIRPAAPDEGDEVGRVVRAAFGDEGEAIAAIVAELASSGLLRSSLVAVVDGEVVGHVATSAAWLDARAARLDVAVLGPLSTAPDFERRGIGTALLAAAVEAESRTGCPLLFLEGAPGFYAERGFGPAAELGFLPPSDRIPVAAFQVHTQPTWDGTAGRLVYPDVWWRHDAVGLRDPDLAELEERFGSW